MTSLQLWLTIGTPSVLVMLGWLHQNQRISDLRTDVHRGFDQVNAHLLRMDADLREFYGTDKQLEGGLNELSARMP